jgi:hypothetical protein
MWDGYKPVGEWFVLLKEWIGNVSWLPLGFFSWRRRCLRHLKGRAARSPSTPSSIHW